MQSSPPLEIRKKNLEKTTSNKFKMAGLAILKIITHKAANNIISLAALLIAFSSLYVSKKSLDTSLSVDTFVKKTDLLINKNSALVDRKSVV